MRARGVTSPASEPGATHIRPMDTQDCRPFCEFRAPTLEAKLVSARKAEQPALIGDVTLLEVPGELRPHCEHQQ